MRIASITMVGQFPQGIDLHTRNLRWALTSDDHSFIITTPEIIQDFNLKNNSHITYIPYAGIGFINFWAAFPTIVKEYSISPEWFMFMEEDIWFFAKPTFQHNPKIIRSFLPIGNYRNILLNNKPFHSRVWEGAQVIHADIVKRAIDFGVNFSFVRQTFVDRNREKYDKDGIVSLSMYGDPDTMDEFSLYCALEEKTKVDQCVKAVHLRGPETLHRKYPNIFNSANLDEIQKEFPYLDVLTPIAVYFIAGLWKKIDNLKWCRACCKNDIQKLLICGKEWMKFHEFKKLDTIHKLCG